MRVLWSRTQLEREHSITCSAKRKRLVRAAACLQARTPVPAQACSQHARKRKGKGRAADGASGWQRRPARLQHGQAGALAPQAPRRSRPASRAERLSNPVLKLLAPHHLDRHRRKATAAYGSATLAASNSCVQAKRLGWKASYLFLWQAHPVGSQAVLQKGRRTVESCKAGAMTLSTGRLQRKSNRLRACIAPQRCMGARPKPKGNHAACRQHLDI